MFVDSFNGRIKANSEPDLTPAKFLFLSTKEKRREAMYDTIYYGDMEAQVKLWFDEVRPMRRYKVGSHVPCLQCLSDRCIASHATPYSIAVKEECGGFINIEENEIVSWTKEAKHDLVLNKYGDIYSEDEYEITDTYLQALIELTERKAS